jgi:hypothetical protein
MYCDGLATGETGEYGPKVWARPGKSPAPFRLGGLLGDRQLAEDGGNGRK